MTYQAPDGWRMAPPPCPQHAAPFASAPVSVHVHRALRLFVTVGAWAAGLCLIVGSVALVAEAAGPSATMHEAAALGHYPQRAAQLSGHGRSPAARRPARRWVPGDRLGTFAGIGSQTTGRFLVAAHSRWELQWSYTCTAAAPGGRLIIREGNGSGGVSVAATGAAGHGSTWTYSDLSAHYLVVLTSCVWAVEVVGRR
jgi:hypothetical protein